jgi:hypothetical protein
VTRHRHFIFPGSPVAICAAAAVVVATATFASAGCKSDKSRDAEAEADRQVAELRKHAKWDDQPTGVKPEPVMVTQGPTPLVYLFDIGGPIRVIDLTSKSQIAAATIGNRTLVRVDDRKGVTAGDTNLMPGPLPAGHNYGIYLDPTTPNVMRQGIGPPGDVPR